jgi:hypothetical protein
VTNKPALLRARVNVLNAMDNPRTTPTGAQRLPSPGHRLDPAAFLAGKDRLARLALLVAALALVSAALSLGLAFSRGRQPVLFVVLDPNGNVILAPGVTFVDARELHVQQSLLAATALLLRNPKDFDQPEILQALLSPGALAQAKAMKAAEAAEFEARQMQQKPQITRIEAIATRQEEVQVEVTGQLARWGLVEQASFSDAVPFSLRLVLKPNPDLARNRRQPVVVTQFTLKYEKPARS